MPFKTEIDPPDGHAQPVGSRGKETEDSSMMTILQLSSSPGSKRRQKLVVHADVNPRLVGNDSDPSKEAIPLLESHQNRDQLDVV